MRPRELVGALALVLLATLGACSSVETHGPAAANIADRRFALLHDAMLIREKAVFANFKVWPHSETPTPLFYGPVAPLGSDPSETRHLSSQLPAGAAVLVTDITLRWDFENDTTRTILGRLIATGWDNQDIGLTWLSKLPLSEDGVIEPDPLLVRAEDCGRAPMQIAATLPGGSD